MIYKVFYQESPTEIPVRENTKSLYVKADHEKDVRNKLVDREYNIEFIQRLDEAHLNYEKQSENYELENA